MSLEDRPQPSSSPSAPFHGAPAEPSDGPLEGDFPCGDADTNPKPTLLVVDDEPAVRRVLVMRLQLAGYRVVCAEDGEQALELFHREQPDLVVLDVMLPKLDGFAVCRRLRAESCVPI
ncbi:MAG: response regulator, partial [Cyanobacteriota bacterium]|nr:response regulator [Cyanobacteriota bacterium]